MLEIRSSPLLWLSIFLLCILGIGSAQAQNAAPPQGCPIGGRAIISCPVTTDDVVRQAVITRLTGTIITRDCEVDVAVRNGVVTLTGQVTTPMQRDMAPALICHLNGVVSIDNQIVVMSIPPRNLALVIEVRQALDRQPFITNNIIVIASEDGVVQLSGTVRNEFASMSAEDVAWGVHGVTAVYNYLTITGSESGTW